MFDTDCLEAGIDTGATCYGSLGCCAQASNNALRIDQHLFVALGFICRLLTGDDEIVEVLACLPMEARRSVDHGVVFVANKSDTWAFAPLLTRSPARQKK
jgi:hypothetical protein